MSAGGLSSGRGLDLRSWALACSKELDVAGCRSANSFGTYLATGALFLCLIALGVYTDLGRDFLGYTSFSVLGWYVVPFSLGVALSLSPAPHEANRVKYWALESATSVSGSLFLFVLIAHSKGISGIIPASMLLTACLFAAPLHRVTMRNPVLPGGVFLSALAAWAMVPAGQLAPKIVIAGSSAAAIAISFVVGGHARRLQHTRLAHDALPTTLAPARSTADPPDHVPPPADVTAFASHYHDISHNLQAAVATFELLKLTLSQEESKTKKIEVRLDQLSQSLTRVTELAADAKSGPCPLPASAVPAHVPSAVESTVGRISHLFPRTRIRIRGREDTYANVLGGENALNRVLENLVINACQGDGKNRASQVSVSITSPVEGNMVSIRVRDNGPGFPSPTAAGQLGSIQARVTTKHGGTGLGLYTASKIVRDSLGSIHCCNIAGGAQVDVEFPQAPRLGASVRSPAPPAADRLPS
ncbi:MAG: HAMP domain-containing sensor histidine kinase [Nannocystaceae bacterium]